MRTGIYTILGIIVITLGVVLFMAVSTVSDVTVSTDSDIIDGQIIDYIPLESSVWAYEDENSFKKLMVTEKIYTSDIYTYLIVKGQEDDKSIKSLRERYQFEYTYEVNKDKMKRSLLGKTLLDPFKEVVLLQNPLKTGEKWRDTWTVESGESYNVVSEITEISDDGENITVTSEESSGKFVVERTLTRGKGETSFNIVEKYEDATFETGFVLAEFKPFEYEGFDNYMAFLENEKISALIDPIKNDSEMKETNESEPTSGNATVENEDEEVFEDDEIDEDVRKTIIASVQLFNDKWITFINDHDMDILNTIVPEGSASKIIDVYMNKEMSQQFLEMDFNRVVIKGNVANVYAYEEIERTMDGVTEVLVYNWIYEVDLIDGTWLVEGYIENPQP